MIIIDAKDLILGRVCTFVAKKALQGEVVHVVNAELAVITGDRRKVIQRYKDRRVRGAPLVGPFFPRMPDRIVKRTIRGMLDYNAPRGKEAFKKVKCHVGVPASLKNEKLLSFPKMSVEKTDAKYISVGEISKELGAKF